MMRSRIAYVATRVRDLALAVAVIVLFVPVQAQPDTEAVARHINGAYVALRDGSLSPHQLPTYLRPVAAVGLGDDELDWILASIQLRTTRYIDIHQSMSTGRLVSTPLPDSLSEHAAIDTAHWLPLLEAAARGQPVPLPDGTLTHAGETYLLAVVASWAQYELFVALEQHLNLATPMSDALRYVGPTLAWIVPMMAVPPDGPAIDAMRVARRVAASLPAWSHDELDSLWDAFDRAPAAVSAMLQYDVLLEVVDVDVTLAIADHVLRGGERSSVLRHAERLRYLGLATISDTDLDEAAITRTVPRHLVEVDARIDQALVDDLVEYRERLVGVTHAIIDLLHRDRLERLVAEASAEAVAATVAALPLLALERTPEYLTAAASSTGDPAVIDVLLRRGAAIDAWDADGMTALMHAAAWNPSAGVTKRLVDNGASLDARDALGRSPLYLASLHTKNPEVVRVLIDAGADVNAALGNGATALMAATTNSHLDVLRVLLDAGADPNARDRDGQTALHVAAHATTDVEVHRLLLSLPGVEVDARSNALATPLILAGEGNPNPAVVRLLLEAGADVNAATRDGGTALNGAAYWNVPEVVELLLGAGADARHVDRFGRLAWQYAAENPRVANTAVFQRLRRAAE